MSGLNDEGMLDMSPPVLFIGDSSQTAREPESGGLASGMKSERERKTVSRRKEEFRSMVCGLKTAGWFGVKSGKRRRKLAFPIAGLRVRTWSTLGYDSD